MAKVQQPQPAWATRRQQVEVLTNRAVLIFNRRHGHGPPPSARGGVVQGHIDTWKLSDANYLELQTLRKRLESTTSELAAAELHLSDCKENLAIAICATTDDTSEAEKLVTDAQAKIAGLKVRLDAINAELPPIYQAAWRAFHGLVADVSESEMSASKPQLEQIIEQIEAVISPLLDQLHAARRDFDCAGKNFPEAASVLGPPPPPNIPERQPTQPGGMVPIVADNRLPRGPVVGPESSRGPDVAFPGGGSGRRWFEVGQP